MLITKPNGRAVSVSDLFCTNHQVPLSRETQKRLDSVIVRRQYTYTRGFYFFQPVIVIPIWHPQQKEANYHIDRWGSKAVANQDQDVNCYQRMPFFFRKAGREATPHKTLFFLTKQPSQNDSKTKNPKSPECKPDVREVTGCLGVRNC